VLHNFNHPVVWIALDPSNPERMYASVLHSNKTAIGGIYVTSALSSGTGATWQKMPNPPRSNGHPYNINVLSNGDLVVSFSARKPTNSTPFTDSSGVYYYNFAASAWYDRSHINMRFWTQDVVVDPNDPAGNTWYGCVFTGWGTPGISGTGGLYKTTDKGLTWTRINDNFRINSCTIRSADPDELYMTTEIDGLWYCGNATSTAPLFSQVTTYPFRHPMRIFINPFKSDEIWVSSFGNGLKTGKTSGSSGIRPDSMTDHPTVTIFPNPCKGFFTITIEPYLPGKDYTYVLYGLLGNELEHGCLSGKSTILFPRNKMSGINILSIFSDREIILNGKVIRQ